MELVINGNWKMKSLLNKSLSQFLLCAVVVFLLSVPVFYLLTKHYYAEDIVDVIEAVQQGNSIPPLDLEEDIMIGMTIQFVLIFAVLCFSLLITLRFITRRLWLPFDDTLRKTEQFNLAQGDIPTFAQTHIKEFARLNSSLKKLMEKDKDTYRIQKEFTENASHELQTPIAITRSKLDLLMQEELNERQMQLVSSLYDLNTRMGHLNRNLLLLAKIENAQYTEMEDIDWGCFIKKALPTYDVLLHGLSLSIADCRKVEHGTLRANAILLECLLNNLVVNAIRHTMMPQGHIEIRLDDNSLSVSNEADGYALDTQTLFRRFRSGEPQRIGNGLGLSIVKAICDYHGWGIEYIYKDNRHLFIVQLKKVK